MCAAGLGPAALQRGRASLRSYHPYVARRGNPARLVIALSVAGVLAIFLVYTSLAGGTPSLRPSSLTGHDGKVSVSGKVVKPVTGDAHGAGLHFRLRDVKGSA